MKTLKHLRSSARGRRLLAGAGLVLTGAALAAVATAVLPGIPEVEARIPNFVRSANPDAVSQVLLDEDIAIQFNTAVLPSSVGPDTILVRTGINNGEQARGQYVVGAFMYDKSVQRRVVIRPEAITEYYEMRPKNKVPLAGGLPRADAERQATTLIRKIERTGQISLLNAIDKTLRDPLFMGSLAGTRLDDANVFGVYPPQLHDANPADDPLQHHDGDDPRVPYRARIAGDDALWQSYLGGDVNAYTQLSHNSEFERFYHSVDAATGVASADSVLRHRQYRRVLIMRRNASRVMFVPELPIRSDLADTGFAAGRAYSIIVPASQPGVFNTVLTLDHQHPLEQTNGRDFSTLFTTVPATNSKLFRAAESLTGVNVLQTPRVVNQTPPNGELLIDPTTDWEDPDNAFNVQAALRKTFEIRLRFAQPLDPRTINPTAFVLEKTASIDGSGNVTTAYNPPVPVAVGTFLNQHRLGIVEVEITPATNLDPQSVYQVTARTLVKSLAGAPLGPNAYIGSFTVGAGKPPLSAVIEDFTSPSGKADPSVTDTFGQVSTAYWPAPATYDTTGSGKLVAAFMPFAGTGVGALSDPRNPGSPLTLDLNLVAGQAITFVTETIDPANPTKLGTQIEYNYTNVSMKNAAANSLGRYPLVIRSQDSIKLSSASINLKGGPGGDGLTNSSPPGATDGPTGGLGGFAGPGGFPGGDGGCSALTDSVGQPILDGGGNLQFDQSKFNGQDGFPGYLAIGTSNLGGGGSGGFSGDAEAANSVNCNPDIPPASSPDYKDQSCTPARFRECGGGGGHATAGGLGDGARGSGMTKTNGIQGGVGGQTYGKADFSDQPKNGLFGTIGVPVLGFGAGGAGGGGGGAEDNTASPFSTAPNGLADASDAGGGGGGGGGGALQMVARNVIEINSSVIDCSGGSGGRTWNAGHTDYGKGAPGGCGAGGSIWLQCYGDIQILNGSRVTVGGGDNANSKGYFQVTQASPPGDRIGQGGAGGSGYLRFEDASGVATVTGSTVTGSQTSAVFAPFDNPSTSAVEADYQAFPGVPFVVNFSQGFSKWVNTGLDTPTFQPHDATPGVTPPDGTSFYSANSTVNIWVRTAPGDTAAGNIGHPNLFLATSAGNTAPWTLYSDVNTISRRRWLQFRVDFTVPLSYDFSLVNLPYVDYLQIDITLN